MSKRPWSSGHPSALPPAKRRQQQQHLYVLLDDWERGCSIYRFGEDDLDADADDDADEGCLDGTPPIARLEARHPLPWAFAAHGTKILAVRAAEGSPAIPGFDTRTMAVVACPLPEANRGMTCKPFYASAAGDRLFVMAYRYIEELGPQPPPDDDRPPPAWSWSGIDDAAPPFCPKYVTCQARHPDGRTVFASVMGWRPGGAQIRQRSTYSFDADRRGFRYHGEWLLPFRGEAHYDGQLDAWVGLADEAPGHVASCDVPSRRAEPAGEASEGPDWKLGEERLFDFDFESTGHLGATLVYMGGGSRYCLIECCALRGDDDGDDPRCRRRVVQMTTFALKYGKKGELRIVGRGGRASMAYTVAHDMNPPTLSPTAFWM
ncbi:hypothetical protein CFC21_111244 [Triticum aestivum]|uniref:DUF1618 domain-containing protein n=2 Tax=Triticum aestivum TaxID=4565 RepID=A0A9R1NEV1_WHEAT|nr:hypothetical protein CFC21_111244 [Triticum aestivum]